MQGTKGVLSLERLVRCRGLWRGRPRALSLDCMWAAGPLCLPESGEEASLRGGWGGAGRRRHMSLRAGGGGCYTDCLSGPKVITQGGPPWCTAGVATFTWDPRSPRLSVALQTVTWLSPNRPQGWEGGQGSHVLVYAGIAGLAGGLRAPGS